MTSVLPTTDFNRYQPFGGGWSKIYRLVARNGNVKNPEYLTGLRVIISNATDATFVQTVENSGRGYLETFTQHVKFSSINGSYAAEIGSWGSPVTETRLAELIANAKAEPSQINQCEVLELAGLQWRFPLDGHATLDVDQTHSVADNNQTPSVAYFTGSVAMPFIPHTPTTKCNLFSPAFFVNYGGFYPPNDFSCFAESQTAGADGLLQIRPETNTRSGNITATGTFDLIKACYLYTTSS